MTSTPATYRDDLTAIARMLRLLGRTTAPAPGQGQQPPDPIMILGRSGQAAGFIRHCADNAHRWREIDASGNPSAPALAAGFTAAALHAATVNQHLAKAAGLAVTLSLTERGAPRTAAEARYKRRHVAAATALAAAEAEADLGHDRVLELANRIVSQPAPARPEPAHATAAAPAARSRR
ncbi:hypothetical protein AB0D10_25165 [Kitasatospora sp. NPDC048545]|uniref:hypothetical protein n=1 Tax=Kitasatospora sp. NPDC048545 TaxID=3157208 RepID=UPI0033D04540